ncbi:MAG TPA: glycosyltransferase family A protein [Verrucomicrobiota bacterium]|nr:glycosyltransferase family 2 protein [Verrucomicrobiota bacterium]HPC54310.1 glycosyltransferase family A protein [Verrucomicrobiota bacterium]HPL37703.1 glycosyltransferase family A protein [Verrucomicrobiota bacterium]HRR65915.1 glycosyltransferase family A protein [Candidatus Paceibacterota bacterium]HRV41443.1 glycosyltransferase family A protein [Candidatus Paceibacterota bacterium]
MIPSGDLADRQSVESSRDPAPCFSVVIPAHNSAAFISQALESVRAQTFQDFEVIVVDDGSTDNTWQAIQGCAGWFPGRFCSIRVEPSQNKGPAGARNLAIRQAKGEFVAFLDSDDLWVPEHLARAKAAFRQNGGKAGLFAGRGQILGSTRFMHESVWPSAEPQPASPELLHACYFPLPSVCVRRALLLAVGGFAEQLVCHEDWLLYLQLSKLTCFIHSPAVECVIRRRSISVTTAVARMSQPMYRDRIKACLFAERSGNWSRGELRAMREPFIQNRSAELADYLCALDFDRMLWVVKGLLASGWSGWRYWLSILGRGTWQFVRRGGRKVVRSAFAQSSRHGSDR